VSGIESGIDGGAGDDGRAVTWRALWLDAAEQLGGDAQAARWLCEEASGAEGVAWLELLDSPAMARAVAHLDRMLARRLAGEPLQYVLGHWGFRRLDLKVDRRVLIPRPETEVLVEVVLELLAGRPTRVVADLGTGSGAVGLALADELPLDRTEIWCTDVSEDAVRVARANAAGLGRAATNIRIAAGSWFEALPDDLRGRLDIVVSNPPYVADDDPEIEAEVRDWEPPGAVFAGPDGLDDLRVLVGEAPRWLAPGGALVVEIGHRQGDDVRALASQAGASAQVRRDLAGRDRVAVLRWPA
jgi:release factor glutamine methyltransferase